MRTKVAFLSAAAVIAVLCTGAQAMPVDALSQRTSTPGLTRVWDNCGHGFHRNYWGRCVSNYGRSSGCPYGMHLGWNVHRCVPN